MRLNHQDCLLKGYPNDPLIPQRGVQQYVYPREQISFVHLLYAGRSADHDDACHR